MTVDEIHRTLELSIDDCREAVWALGAADVVRVLDGI
jgi:hypothetical protein